MSRTRHLLVEDPFDYRDHYLAVCGFYMFDGPPSFRLPGSVLTYTPAQVTCPTCASYAGRVLS